jgi:hypothetical protein
LEDVLEPNLEGELVIDETGEICGNALLYLHISKTVQIVASSQEEIVFLMSNLTTLPVIVV